MTALPTLKELMSSGVHFGHRSSRWNPKMKPYIFMKRNLIHIIDLKHTLRNMVVATKFLTNVAARGGEILFVGTKRQARNVILNQARRTGMHYVNERWLGGTLTNFSVIRTRMKRLDYLEELEKSPKFKLYSKKMQAGAARVKSKMLRNLEGIRRMQKLPDAIVIIDPGREKNALSEANKLKIPVVAVLDTDCDPENVDVPIPANDDAMRSIAMILETLGESVIEGVERHKAYVGPVSDAAPKVETKVVRRRPPAARESGARREGGSKAADKQAAATAPAPPELKPGGGNELAQPQPGESA